MFVKVLNILSSLMLSASCVNGLSSLDHKSSRQIDAFSGGVFAHLDSNISFFQPQISGNGTTSEYYDGANISTYFYNWLNGTSNFGLMFYLDDSLDNTSNIITFYQVDNTGQPIVFGLNFYNDFSTSLTNCYLSANLSDYLDDLYIDLFYCEVAEQVGYYSFSYTFTFDGKFVTYNDVNYFSSTSSNKLFFTASNNVSHASILFLNFYSKATTSTDTYTNGYANGYNDGYDLGYNVGYNNGVSSSSAGRNLFLSIADTPMLMLRSLFNFEFFGVNFFIIVVGLLTMLFIVYLVKKFI